MLGIEWHDIDWNNVVTYAISFCPYTDYTIRHYIDRNLETSHLIGHDSAIRELEIKAFEVDEQFRRDRGLSAASLGTVGRDNSLTEPKGNVGEPLKNSEGVKEKPLSEYKADSSSEAHFHVAKHLFDKMSQKTNGRGLNLSAVRTLEGDEDGDTLFFHVLPPCHAYLVQRVDDGAERVFRGRVFHNHGCSHRFAPFITVKRVHRVSLPRLSLFRHTTSSKTLTVRTRFLYMCIHCHHCWHRLSSR